MEPGSLRAGEVAVGAGVHRETLRYYERRGLIPAPPRRASGYRAYPPETVERVRLIKWAQGLGFTLREIRRRIALRRLNVGSIDRTAPSKRAMEPFGRR